VLPDPAPWLPLRSPPRATRGVDPGWCSGLECSRHANAVTPCG